MCHFLQQFFLACCFQKEYNRGMTHLTFDKLVYVDRLQTGGFTSEQARIHADALEGALHDAVATKHDIESVKRDVGSVRQDMQLVEQRLINKMGMMLVGLAGFLVAIKYLG
jgi:hypothetical protein